MAPGVLYRVVFGTPKPQEHQMRQLQISPAILQGYGRYRVKFADYPGIIEAPDSSVKGTYVTGLTPMDIVRLDMFEGDQYDRKEVHVQILKPVSSSNGAEDAVPEVDRDELTETYVFNDKDDLEEGEWDFETFKRDKLRAWTLEAREDFQDLTYGDQQDGTRGRGVTGDITAQLKAQLEKQGGDHEKAIEVTRSAV